MRRGKKYLRGMVAFLSFCVAAIATPLGCQTSGPLPGTPPGRRLAELIAVLNSGDYAAIRSYVDSGLSESFTRGAGDDRADALMRLHAGSGALTVVKVLSSSGDRVVAEVRNQLAEMNQALGVSVEDGRAHRITMWYQGPAFLYGKAGEAPRLDDRAIVAAMDSALRLLSAAGVFSGTVLVAKGDSVLLRRAVGLAHRSPDVPNGLDTRFNIASVGKLFTTIAVAQLAERGLLTYQDSVGRYLGSDWVSPDVASGVRIEHLLTHRSGLGDFLEDEAMRNATAPPRALDDYKSVIRAERPQFTPGTRFQYSNSGFILLGAIVERVTGRTFDEYVREHVLATAGMVESGDPGPGPVPLAAPAFATGYSSSYSSRGCTWSDNTDLLARVTPSPAGGQYASVEDLWRLATALRTGALVRDSTWQSLASPAPIRGGPPTGYGFEITDRGVERRVGHGGSHEGIGAVLDIYLRSGYTLAVLSNSDRSALVFREKFASLVMP